jgi:AraC-like DNA-binding protein
MPYREVVPHPALRPFVDRFWARWGTGRTEVLRVLPDGCIDLVIDLADGGGGFVVGSMSRSDLVQLGPAHRLVAVRFRPAGAVPLLGVAARELTDRQVDVADLGMPWLSAVALQGTLARAVSPHEQALPGASSTAAVELDRTASRLGEAEPMLAVVAAMEALLLGRLPAVPAPDPVAVEAVRGLVRGRPDSVDRVARRLGVSRQHLGRVVRGQVGVAPKVLGRIARVHRAVWWLQSGRAVNLAEVAVRAGYYDEAHMDRDFRELVGTTPGVARAAAGSIRPMLSVFREA